MVKPSSFSESEEAQRSTNYRRLLRIIIILVGCVFPYFQWLQKCFPKRRLTDMRGNQLLMSISGGARWMLRVKVTAGEARWCCQRWEDFLAELQCPHQWGDPPLSLLPTRTFFVGCHVTLVIKAGSRGHRCLALRPSSPLTVAARWWIHTISWYIWTWGDVRKPRPIPSKLSLVKGAGFPFLLGWPTVRILQYPRVRTAFLIFLTRVQSLIFSRLLFFKIQNLYFLSLKYIFV